MGAPYANRRIGTYGVELSVLCSRLPCSVEAEAMVRGTSCEEARQGVMRVLRYRGWQLGKHAATLCPRHAPPPVECVRCKALHPPEYIATVGEIPFRDEAVPELKDFGYRDALCVGCTRWARDLVFHWHQRDRTVTA